jgi:hypothetical protein
MGESWRIGIDQEHRTPLVRKGVFGGCVAKIISERGSASSAFR